MTKGIAIFTGTKETVQKDVNFFLTDSAFEILDVKFSTASENYNSDDRGMCYSVMVYYNEIKTEEK